MNKQVLLHFVVIYCLVGSAAVRAESVAAGWQRVVQLKPGTSLHVKTFSKGNTTCKVESVDEAELVCLHGAKDRLTLPRSEIRSIKMVHRGRSALTGLLVGAGIGAGIGAGVEHATETPSNGVFSLNRLGKGILTLAGGVIGGIVGAAISTPLDITAGAPIYQAP
jgi:hypothetical protein